MSIKGFIVNGSTQKYDYNELDNKPTINGIPSGGSAGQVLAKNSSTNYDVTWVNQSGGGGGGGTSDYSDLINKPSINSVTLTGNKTTSELGLVSTTDLHNVPSGGSAGQVLAKSSSADYDVTWIAQSGGGGGEGLTDAVKTALLQIAGKVAYIDTNGQNYYQALYDALYGSTPTTQYTIVNNLSHVTNSNAATSIVSGGSYTGTLTAATGYGIDTVSITMGGVDVTGTSYSGGTITIANVTGNIVITAVATERTATLLSIDAVFTQGSAVIYNTDTLDTLKQYLTVTANWDDSTTSTVASSDYTLSGTLTAGTSTITASYGGKSDTFSVTVTEVPLYTFPTVTDYSSSQGTAVSGGNSISFSSTGNSRHIYVSKTRVDSYINQGPGVFFSLNANDSYSLTLKNIAYSGNNNSGNYFFVSVYGVSPYVPIETETQACVNSSGTLSDVTVTGTVETAGNVIGVKVENYRDMTISFDVELRINGTRYL